MKCAFTLLVCILSSYAKAGSVERVASDLPVFGSPPHGEARWIAKSMRYNGLPMTVQAFRSRLSAADVLRHYEGEVRHGSTRERVRSRNGEWQVLAFKEAHAFVTIQARDARPGSVGTITVSASRVASTHSFRTRLPVPASLRLVELQQYEDRGIESEHVGLVSSRAPHVEAASCVELLRRGGWSIVLDAPARTIAGGHVIEAQRGAEHSRLTIVPDRSGTDRTAVIIVWRKA